MSEFKSICRPFTLELAIEHARDGRPEMLLWFVDDKMGPDAAAALADLLLHPEKLAKAPRATFLPNEAEAIRAVYKQKRKLFPRERAPILQDKLARSLGISFHLLRDILLRKNSYAEKRVSTRQDAHPRKHKK